MPSTTSAGSEGLAVTSSNNHAVSSSSSSSSRPSTGISMVLDRADLEVYLDPSFDALEYSRKLVDLGSRNSSGEPGSSKQQQSSSANGHSSNLSSSSSSSSGHRSPSNPSSGRSSAEECLLKLQRQRASVESALSAHVAEHNDELMTRLAGTEALRASALMNREHASALSASVGRLTRDVSEPFKAMKRDAAKLRKLQSACRILDRTRRFLAEVNKLKVQLLHENARRKDPAQLARGDLKLPASGRELAKAAQMLHEIEYLLESGDLQGLDYIDRERTWLVLASKGLRARTEAVLNKAIAELNQVEAAAALQAFFNLGILPSRVEAAVDWVVSKVAEETRDALDAHMLSDAVETLREQKNSLKAAKPQASQSQSQQQQQQQQQQQKPKSRTAKASSRIKPPAGEEGEWREALWERVKAQETSIRTWSLRVWNLQRVLAKKRDPVTHICFADQVLHASQQRNAQQNNVNGTANGNASASAASQAQQNSDTQGQDQQQLSSPSGIHKRRHRPETVYERYWRLMTQAVHGEIEKASRMYPFVRNELGVQRYPKLRAMFRALPGRLAQRTAGKSVASVGGSNEEVLAILRALQPLLEWFLAQSLRRLNQPVDLMFPEVESARALAAKQNLLPTRNDVLTFAATISNELAAAHNDVDLSSAIGKGASSAVSLFATKAEHIVVHDPDAYIFPGGASSAVNGGASSDSESSDSSEDESDASSFVGSERTAAQQHNVSVLSLVLKLEALVADMPEKTTPAKVESRDAIVRAKSLALRPARERLHQVVESIAGEYLAGAARSLNHVLAKIHQEDFCRGSEAEMESDSPYLTTFENAVASLRKEHLEKLPVEYIVITQMCQALQARVVSMFTRHVSMVRPLDSNGRLRLVRDLAQFELAVAPLAISSSAKLSEIGDPYVELRGMRELLFVGSADERNTSSSRKHAAVDSDGESVLTPETVELSPVDRTVQALTTLSPRVRFSTLAHSIFADAPPELRSLSSFAKHPNSNANSSSNVLTDELSYSDALDTLELEQDKAAASTDLGGLAYLRVGTHLVEPRRVKEYIQEQIALVMDKYMQLLSAQSNDGQIQACPHYKILEKTFAQSN